MEFLADIVARVRYSINVRYPIESMNHEQLKGKQGGFGLLLETY